MEGGKYRRSLKVPQADAQEVFDRAAEIYPWRGGFVLNDDPYVTMTIIIGEVTICFENMGEPLFLKISEMADRIEMEDS